MSLVELLRSMDKPLLDQGPFIEVRGALREASNRIEQLETLNAEMLEALELLVQYYDDLFDGKVLEVEHARAAISKAKGKTNLTS